MRRITSIVKRIPRLLHVMILMIDVVVTRWRRPISLVVVDVLARILIVARVGLSDHTVGSAGSSPRVTWVLCLAWILTILRTIPLHHRGEIVLVSWSQSQLWWLS